MLRWVRFEEQSLSSLSNFKHTSCLAGYNNHNDNTWLIFKPLRCLSDKGERKSSSQSLAGGNRLDIRADFEKTTVEPWAPPHSGPVICKNLCNVYNFCVILPTPSASDCQQKGEKDSFLELFSLVGLGGDPEGCYLTKSLCSSLPLICHVTLGKPLLILDLNFFISKLKDLNCNCQVSNHF